MQNVCYHQYALARCQLFGSSSNRLIRLLFRKTNTNGKCSKFMDMNIENEPQMRILLNQNEASQQFIQSLLLLLFVEQIDLHNVPIYCWFGLFVDFSNLFFAFHSLNLFAFNIQYR